MGRYAYVLILFFLAAALNVFTLCEASAVEILYPEDGTFFLRSNYLIIKAGQSPLVDAISLELNGEEQGILDISASEYRAAFGDMVILQPQFQRGKNLLKVEGYVNGEKVASAVSEIFYLEGDSNLTPPPRYRPFVMHTLEREAICAPCHNMNPDRAQNRASSAEENPCGGCHARMLAQKYVHGPAGVFQCIYCHDPASRPSKYSVPINGAPLCNQCHADKSEAFARNEYVHGPVGVGLCGLCHDSHASSYPAQLRDSVNTVCLQCHSTIAEGLHIGRNFVGKGHILHGPRDPRRPEKQFTCASCHDPHGGASRNLFIAEITDRMQLCFKCHPK